MGGDAPYQTERLAHKTEGRRNEIISVLMGCRVKYPANALAVSTVTHHHSLVPHHDCDRPDFNWYCPGTEGIENGKKGERLKKKKKK